METFSVPSSHRQKTFEMFAAGATLNHPQQPARMDEDLVASLLGGHSQAGLSLRIVVRIALMVQHAESESNQSKRDTRSSPKGIDVDSRGPSESGRLIRGVGYNWRRQVAS